MNHIMIDGTYVHAHKHSAELDIPLDKIRLSAEVVAALPPKSIRWWMLSVIKIGPPSFAGGFTKFDFSGMKKTSYPEPFEVAGKEVNNGSLKSKPFNLGMQLSCSMDTKIQKE